MTEVHRLDYLNGLKCFLLPPDASHPTFAADLTPGPQGLDRVDGSDQII